MSLIIILKSLLTKDEVLLDIQKWHVATSFTMGIAGMFANGLFTVNSMYSTNNHRRTACRFSHDRRVFDQQSEKNETSINNELPKRPDWLSNGQKPD